MQTQFRIAVTLDDDSGIGFQPVNLWNKRLEAYSTFGGLLVWRFSGCLDSFAVLFGAGIGFAWAIDSPSFRSWATSRNRESIA
jgi:hypothetical protein